MGGDRNILVAPSVAPLSSVAVVERQQHLSNFDSTVNALSFGFVATAVLILMFLVMAIFERFLRPRSSASSSRNPGDLEAQIMKLDYPSPKMSIYAKGVSVLMPGEEIPTFIAHPVPAPCHRPPELISRPLHESSVVSIPSASLVTS
ncbi:Cttnbp 2 amino-terminal-like protein [Heracleum sosnowskyi]|uniref:Cttnbp 2 amino-terminal-like protein n=1 Tax=Heracleum sosnowskyi TaxID=360622 RepID=A0AAD8N3B0_9APIA|nr:Cttnbp 2 amino-terminal-like protein [Heracleum sosnowskyi]